MMRHFPTALIFGLATFGTGAVPGPDSPLERADPGTRELFQAVATSYKSPPSYRDEGVFTRTIQLAGREVREDSPMSVAFEKPGRLALDTGEVRLVADGKTLTTVLLPTRKYLTAPAPERLLPTTISEGPAGAILFGSVSGAPSQLLLRLILGVDPVSALPDKATSLTREEGAKLDGRTMHALRIGLGDEPSLRVLIDPETHLIRRMETMIEAGSAANRVPSVGEIGGLSLSWSSGPITTTPHPESFAFTPPEGFTRVKAAEAKPTAAEPKSELLGKIAPDFRLNILQGSGKTQTLTRADLAGKVVLLDFWATWCPPCLEELPEIQALAETYAKAGKGQVVIVAVSQDRAPDDGSPVRALVEELLKSKNLKIADGPVARVALDPDQVVGDAFKIQALPTVVLLDAKGQVQSVHVGFRDDLRQALTEEIDALLDGKDLPRNPSR